MKIYKTVGIALSLISLLVILLNAFTYIALNKWLILFAYIIPCAIIIIASIKQYQQK